MDRSDKPSPPFEAVFQTAVDLMRRSAGEQDIPISGESMLPLLRDGDRVRLKYGAEGIRRGAIVVFRQGQGLVAHRVLSRREDPDSLSFLTKGDNVWRADPLVPADAILGRVLAIKRGNRQLSIDTPAWQIVSWVTALSMLPWASLYERIGHNRPQAAAGRPSQVESFLSRGLRVLLSWPMLLLHPLIARWESPISPKP